MIFKISKDKQHDSSAISFISNVLTAQTLGTGVEMSRGFLHFKANYN